MAALNMKERRCWSVHMKKSIQPLLRRPWSHMLVRGMDWVVISQWAECTRVDMALLIMLQ